MAASCRKAAQARLWSSFFKDPSLWKDNRNTKTNPRAPDFTHKLTNQPLWLDSWFNPSWVHDRLKRQKTAEPLTTMAHRDARDILCDMLSSLQDARQTCSDVLSTHLHAMQMHGDMHISHQDALQRPSDMLSSHGDALHMQADMLQSHSDGMHTCDDTFSYVASPRFIGQGMHDLGNLLHESRKGNDLAPPSDSGKLPHDDLAELLHKCKQERDVVCALRLHHYMHECGLNADTSLGNNLVLMLVDVGSLCNAQQVFDKLECHYESSWNALITGYGKCGESQNALDLYQKMQDSTSLHPSATTFVALLKACTMLKDLEMGGRIHAHLDMGLTEVDVFVGSTLINMYAKCGRLAKAQEVLNDLQVQNVVSWNALIAGYVEHGHSEEALDCYKQMYCIGISPDGVTLVCSLKACGDKGDAYKGREIHAEIVRKGFMESDVYIGSTLIDMYANCGSLAEAQEVFDKLPVCNVVAWNALIAGYTEHGHGEKALNCFEQMQHGVISPDAVTLICSLKACASIAAGVKAQQIHAEIVRKGLLDSDIFLGSILVDAYAKCGWPADSQSVFGYFSVGDAVLWNALISGLTEHGQEAQNVFERLPARDVVSWNALLAGYADHKLGEEALKCVKLMQLEGFAPDAITFVCSLKVCSSIGAIITGREIHIEVVKKGLLENEVGNALIDMYAKCCLLADAQNVFVHLPALSVVSLNTLISGYIECGYGEKALRFYDPRQREHISADSVMLVCSLKACGAIKAIAEGQEIHEAQETFHKLQTRDTVAWTALITGYVEHGCCEEALYYSEKMLNEDVLWDAAAFVCSLTACGNARAAIKGGALHAEAARKGLLDTELSVGSTLVNMYAKCGSLGDAQKVFHNLPFRDIASWNALIAGYVELGCGEGAISLFEQMRLEGISYDASTLVCGLKACGSMGATVKGQEVHSEIVKKGLDTELLMGNTLVDVYVKCGVLAAAQEAFDKLLVRDLVTWNTLIAGYGQRGQSEIVFLRFDKMREEGITPDLVTLSSVLNACSHAGVVDMGQMYFEAFSYDYGVIPTLEHYTCIVDLLGRAGQVDKAMAVINKMPLHPGIVAWHSALGACQRWGNVEIGKHAFESVMGLDENDAAAYVCMCNIYANAAIHEQEM